MYAVIQTGGKQYKVAAGDQLKVEKMTAEPGSKVIIDSVLAIGEGTSLNVGTPLVPDAKVHATLIRTARDRKIVVYKKKRRKGYHKKQGHRQWFSLLKVDMIQLGDQEQPAAVVEEMPHVQATEAPVTAASQADTAPETAPAGGAAEGSAPDGSQTT